MRFPLYVTLFVILKLSSSCRRRHTSEVHSMNVSIGEKVHVEIPEISVPVNSSKVSSRIVPTKSPRRIQFVRVVPRQNPGANIPIINPGIYIPFRNPGYNISIGNPGQKNTLLRQLYFARS